MHQNPYRPPDGERRAPRMEQLDGEWLLWLFFSLQGRVNRRPFWLFTLFSVLVYSLPIYLMAIESGYAQQVELAVIVLLLWPNIAVQAKRWHDIDWSGWWILINLVPLVGPLFALAMNGFVRGTGGPNRFGEDPLGTATEDEPGQRLMDR